ncbi:hypothetical protein BX600DRAFT_389283 [Xylariales sp. PMI_506]|nr:hypothetical protein BX600DRAFT_389283 [Xylariales sp. PMI_506]
MNTPHRNAQEITASEIAVNGCGIVHEHINGLSTCKTETESINAKFINGHLANPGSPEKPQVQQQYDPTAREPIAICGMACRLPGGIESPQDLWDFILAKRDAREPVPPSRYNISGYYSATSKPGTTRTKYGYFLDDSVDLGGLDSSFYAMTLTEIERVDPQQRLLLEVTREALDDAGETNWRGENIGVYAGNYGQDWYDLCFRDPQQFTMYQVTGSHELMLSNRISYELNLRGPSMTIRTGCSAALVGLNEACVALERGDCKSAIVGGTNLILTPALTATMSEAGVLNEDASCKTFSADADGYGRAEAIIAIFIKPLKDALRDGNPVRAVISGTAVNHDGKTNGISVPSADAQEALIRRAYQTAGISAFSDTGFVECHGTGTAVGDPIEAEAVGRVFGTRGVHIGSVKANLGHSEGASGLTSILKAVLALEHRTIPPNIKSSPPNPKIPFERCKLTVPIESTPWPADRRERVSVNSFGIGGTNAHIILESAASFGIASRHSTTASSLSMMKNILPKSPQLLLYSANTANSLRQMAQRYHQFLESNPGLLTDTAFTLANRRIHMPFRSFAISNADGIGQASPVPLSGKPSQPPFLVMVFTGQGAQWPQMGRELLRANPVFRQTIRALDQALQDIVGVAPSWKIEEELAKPARTSRIHEAEFSQPICTALQIALVELLASAGIKPRAVVGHSSGEIAAAYAAGAITQKNAMAIAFHRGVVSKAQTRTGAMAAVGLGWEEARDVLVPGVVVACDNSPGSVTISGDSAPLEKVVADIKQTRPDVSVTVLKVDKAYHSHHIVEVGSDYHQAMVNSKVESRVPDNLFFSSVTGRQYGAVDGDDLGPKYWQKNMESPVLFRGAVTSILKSPDVKNPIFLEIGPHSALAGPMRQILTHESSKAPYVATIVRRNNSVENYLTTLGHLFTLHLKVDFQAVISSGFCLPDLPRYPWDHDQSNWFETRMSKEWRLREHAYHDLLGIKLPESTDIEPVWRNLFHLANAPWMRDHRIKGDIIFPFAGYVGIIAEAIRQVTRIEEGVSFRSIAVKTALVVSESKPTEIVTTLRRHRLTNSLDSHWWEFSVSSHNGHNWTKHCSGEVMAVSGPAPETKEILESLPRKVNIPKWYDGMRQGSLDYGYHFTTLRDVTTSTTGQRLARAKTLNNWHGDEDCYHLHPIILDSYLQLVSCAAGYGIAQDVKHVVPTSVQSLTVHRCSVDELEMSAKANIDGNIYTGDGICVADSRIVLQVSAVTFSYLKDPLIEYENKVAITARAEWVPHIDFLNPAGLFKLPDDLDAYMYTVEEVAKLGTAISQRSASRASEVISAMQKWKDWLESHNNNPWRNEDETELLARMEILVKSLIGTPVASIGKAVYDICTNTTDLLFGTNEAVSILDQEDILNDLHASACYYDVSSFLKNLANTKPNLRIMEIGAGTGLQTRRHLKALTRADGQALFSQYISTDPSPTVINSNREHIKDIDNIEFAVFDIGENPADQGFEGFKFDLIIATNALHRAPDLENSISYICKLLAPEGRLLVQETLPHPVWSKYVFGSMSDWWVGDDGDSPDGPYRSPSEWHGLFTAAGLRLSSSMGMDSKVPSSSSAVLLYQAKKQQQRNPLKTVGILHSEELSRECSVLSKEMQDRGYETLLYTLANLPPAGMDVIVLFEFGTPFFNEMTASRLEKFQALVNNLGDASLFWLTSPSQIRCQDPSYAKIFGLARTLRSELGLNFAVCEVGVDELDFSDSVDAVADVFTRFQQREKETDMDPDFEYSIIDGTIRVSRFFPFELDKELQVSSHSEEAILELDRPGRLDSLQWSVGSSAPAPQGDEIELEVHSVGLNFRDILVAMGIIELPVANIGYEASGIVSRVGPDVTKLRVGDRMVMTGVGAFSTHVRSSELFCDKLPDDLSFQEGASMPLVFATAIYSLIDIGRLTKGQSVLIHSACGGVGLAAIQVAQMLGADIYATVSSEEKVQYLMHTFAIPREHIFDSRSTDFVDGLMRETNGKGADLVLNSLSGDLLHATWHCVAKWGTMVEIGKRDLLGAGKLDMDVFLANRSYCCVDVDQMRLERPLMIDRLLRSMFDYYRQGKIKPVRLAKEFMASEVKEAFRYMQQGSHIGKIVIQMRDSQGNIQLGSINDKFKMELQLDSSASYLLIGGLGGLGRSISVWMAQNGARHFIFLSRRAGSGVHDEDFKHELESMGCSVHLIRGSVTNRDDVTLAVNAAASNPLKGIIQMSMVLRDQSFPRMSIEEWTEGIQPKVDGTMILHEVTQSQGQDLDFFVLFSSLSGVLGQPGQANYSAANAFLDCFVQYRNSLGLCCTAIDIGPMEGAGYLAENEDLLRKMQATGWRAVQERELFEALSAAMLLGTINHGGDGEKRKSNKSDVFVDTNKFLLGVSPIVPLSHPESSARLRKDIRMAVYHNAGSNSQNKTSESSSGIASLISSGKQDPSVFANQETAVRLAEEIGKRLHVLLLKSGNDVDISLSLSDLGMDSLVAVEMRAWWKHTFGFDISVLEMLGMGTLEALGNRAAEGLSSLYRT